MCFPFYSNNNSHMITLWKQIPNDVLENILSYTGVIKQRNGKYMKQILKTDPRYLLLANIHKLECYWYIPSAIYKKVEFTNRKYKLIITINMVGPYIYNSNEYRILKYYNSFMDCPAGTECWQIIKGNTRYEFLKTPVSLFNYLCSIFRCHFKYPGILFH